MSNNVKCPQCAAALAGNAPEGLCPACLLKAGAAADTGTQSSSPLSDAPSVEELAPLFPRLEILELVGKGGMGAVYKARQPALDRLVALKVLPVQAAVGADFAERFDREAKALARLNHPSIVAVHEFGRAGELPFLILEYVDGLNLREIERVGKLSPGEALQIIPQICDALQFAHDQGVIHRDIKPENILVDKQGQVKITDFGIAKILEREGARTNLTAERQVIGTPNYMAPEQVEKPLEVDHRADIYSLGVVFYEMLTGELPLGRFEPPSKKVVVDVRLDEVVLRALEKAPERRYQQASQLRTQVETIRQGATDADPERQETGNEKRDDSGPAPASPTEITGNAPVGLNESYGSFRAALGAVPGLLWIAVATMAAMTVWKVTTVEGYLAWIWADLLLVGGLLTRFKLAYVLTLFFALFGFLTSLFSQPSLLVLGILAINLLVGVPVVLCTDWFFPRASFAGRRQGADVLALGLILLPPLLLQGFLLIEQTAWGLHFEPVTRLLTGIVGLPLSVAGGAALALGMMALLDRRQAGPTLSPQDRKRRISPWAISATVLFGLSLPAGGGALVMARLIAEDPNWNPVGAELGFAIGLAAGGGLPAIAGVLCGVAASHELRMKPGQLRGHLPAVIATWFWPVLVLWTLYLSAATYTPEYRRADRLVPEQVRRAARMEQDKHTAQTEAASRSTVVPEAGRFHVTLFNGARVEVVGICRNPRNSDRWWKPDGTPLPEPPARVLELPDLVPTTRPVITIEPENELLFYVRWDLPEGTVIYSQQPRFSPAPSDTESPAMVLDLADDRQTVAELVCFDTLPATVDYEVATSFGPWQAVSVYNPGTKTTRDLKSGVMALWSEPRYDARSRALRYEVMHNTDRDRYALRMNVRLRDGDSETMVFHPGPVRGRPAKGFALWHGDENDSERWLANVVELRLERTPWIRTQLREISLPPNDQEYP